MSRCLSTTAAIVTDFRWSWLFLYACLRHIVSGEVWADLVGLL